MARGAGRAPSRAPHAGLTRAVVERVTPEVDGGRFPIKRIAGDRISVEADIFADGHDRLAAALLWKPEGRGRWNESPMLHFDNDRWRGEFRVERLGRYLYTVAAWVEPFATWRDALSKRVAAGQDVAMDLVIGSNIVEEAARGAGKEAATLRTWVSLLRSEEPAAQRVEAALSETLAALMDRNGVRRHPARYARELAVVVDPIHARFSSWYEMFPRSASPEPGRHGTFKDAEARLDYVEELGFDVLYLPPIHPIAHTMRKGPNNTLQAAPGDPGSPWAIGTREEGGHKSFHPDLGDAESFRSLVRTAARRGIRVAIDVAFQASPDHPYVHAHPEWFSIRPDGSIQYAENPPKKYQDIYPFNFDSEHWRPLWEELKSVFEFWIEEGVTIFRVDNPHTKSFQFWEWCLGGIKAKHPEAIFLSEAFTRPKVMYRLAKLGFTQSYTYFPWRNTKQELTDYSIELTAGPVREFFRPNHWTNTPDILPEALRDKGRSAFAVRFVLASTLAASYGIYGPAFELLENKRLKEGAEEYLDSEKYQLRHWDLDRSDSLRDLIARVNGIRKSNPALQADWSLAFHATDNDNLLCYSKRDAEADNTIVVLINLDDRWPQSGWVTLDCGRLGLDRDEPFGVTDLLTGAKYSWKGPRNFVSLDPARMPAHILLVTREPEPSGKVEP